MIKEKNRGTKFFSYGEKESQRLDKTYPTGREKGLTSQTTGRVEWRKRIGKGMSIIGISSKRYEQQQGG